MHASKQDISAQLHVLGTYNRISFKVPNIKIPQLKISCCFLFCLEWVSFLQANLQANFWEQGVWLYFRMTNICNNLLRFFRNRFIWAECIKSFVRRWLIFTSLASTSLSHYKREYKREFSFFQKGFFINILVVYFLWAIRIILKTLI